MSYEAAIDQLNAMTPELHTQPGQPRRKFSLDEIRTLLGALGDPQQAFKSVLIAGTNGKGSTAATLASILKASGLRTGLYTSPHLTRPNERIRVAGEEIRDEDFARLFFKVHDCGSRLIDEGRLAQLPSFFEMLTAMAFLYFAECAVEMAVLEVGMGGRLDATNVVSPLLSIVTDISLDHTEWLGPTISAIAREKAGILRPHGTLVTLPQHPEANQVLGEIALALEARAVSAVPYMPQSSPHNRRERSGGGDFAAEDPAYKIDALGAPVEVSSPLHGEHQHRNLALAIAAAVELAGGHRLPITAAAIAEGIHATRWPGRLERIFTGQRTGRRAPPETTEWILDVAHNPAGAWALRAALRAFLGLGEPEAPPAALVFGCLRDKPLGELAQILFPLFDEVIFAPIQSPRATAMADLLASAAAVGTAARAAPSVAAALARAEEVLETLPVSLSAAGARGRPAAFRRGPSPGAAQAVASGENARRVIVVAGSVYLVGEVRPLLLARAAQP